MKKDINSIFQKVSEELYKTKAEDIKIINISKKSNILDYIIIVSGTSTIHLNLLANTIKKEMKKYNFLPNHREGINDDTRWIVIDYGDFMFHVMMKNIREMYNLENLWKEEIKID